MWPLVTYYYEIVYPLPVFKQEAIEGWQVCFCLLLLCKSYVILYGMIVNFCGDQISMDFIRFLAHEVLCICIVFKVYLQCLVFYIRI